eukprot:gene5356-5573_t
MKEKYGMEGALLVYGGWLGQDFNTLCIESMVLNGTEATNVTLVAADSLPDDLKDVGIEELTVCGTGKVVGDCVSHFMEFRILPNTPPNRVVNLFKDIMLTVADLPFGSDITQSLPRIITQHSNVSLTVFRKFNPILVMGVVWTGAQPMHLSDKGQERQPQAEDIYLDFSNLTSAISLGGTVGLFLRHLTLVNLAVASETDLASGSDQTQTALPIWSFAYSRTRDSLLAMERVHIILPLDDFAPYDPATYVNPRASVIVILEVDSSPNMGSGSGLTLSTGAIAGIAVGVGVGMILLIAAAVLFALQRKKRRDAEAEAAHAKGGDSGSTIEIGCTGMGERSTEDTTGVSYGSKGKPQAQLADLLKECGKERLTLYEPIGKGAFGTVYRGRWLNLDVAVKTVLFSDKRRVKVDADGRIPAGSQEMRAVTEAAVCTSVVHPNVVSTYHYDIKMVQIAEDDPQTEGGFVVQDQCPQTDWKLFLVQLFSNLYKTSAHRPIGSVSWFRDLKPDNVMLKHTPSSPSGMIAKITDFGLSTTIDPGQSHISNFENGTPFYCAPEIGTIRTATRSSDAYSFGVLMVEMYRCLAPWVKTYNGFAYNPDFLRFPSDTPERYLKLCKRCMDHSPKARPTFEELVVELNDMYECLLAGAGNLERDGQDNSSVKTVGKGDEVEALPGTKQTGGEDEAPPGTGQKGGKGLPPPSSGLPSFPLSPCPEEPSLMSPNLFQAPRDRIVSLVATADLVGVDMLLGSRGKQDEFVRSVVPSGGPMFYL